MWKYSNVEDINIYNIIIEYCGKNAWYEYYIEYPPILCNKIIIMDNCQKFIENGEIIIRRSIDDNDFITIGTELIEPYFKVNRFSMDPNNNKLTKFSIKTVLVNEDVRYHILHKMAILRQAMNVKWDDLQILFEFL